VRAVARGVSVVTLRAGGSCRSSTAEKRYFEEDVDDVEVLVVGTEAMEAVEVIPVSRRNERGADHGAGVIKTPSILCLRHELRDAPSLSPFLHLFICFLVGSVPHARFVCNYSLTAINQAPTVAPTLR